MGPEGALSLGSKLAPWGSSNMASRSGLDEVVLVPHLNRRRAEGRRIEKSVHVEDKKVRRPDGRERVVSLFARGGAIGIVELSDIGEPNFLELKRIKTHRIQDKTGLFRWYNDYLLPTSAGGGVVTVRLHGNDQDSARKFNRTENVRVIPAFGSRLQGSLRPPKRRGVDQPVD
jgi:hypothetical protein